MLTCEAKVLGRVWAEEKKNWETSNCWQYWNAQAEELSRRHKLGFPNYTYQPKKAAKDDDEEEELLDLQIPIEIPPYTAAEEIKQKVIDMLRKFTEEQANGSHEGEVDASEEEESDMSPTDEV
ncbi:Uu.00g143900.m01.CDS01 [Anthostomella pinea]|uniref:Uu.00g143900.m01.CDS01 n=1 Tax=Anthostomella pinea TaxID=933095 RepID=A0AAI8YLR2_9PEZI|nr:Uu.00g143900.m01.CDS01 [Anthostomella pinea]